MLKALLDLKNYSDIEVVVAAIVVTLVIASGVVALEHERESDHIVSAAAQIRSELLELRRRAADRSVTATFAVIDAKHYKTSLRFSENGPAHEVTTKLPYGVFVASAPAVISLDKPGQPAAIVLDQWKRKLTVALADGEATTAPADSSGTGAAPKGQSREQILERLREEARRQAVTPLGPNGTSPASPTSRPDRAR